MRKVIEAPLLRYRAISTFVLLAVIVITIGSWSVTLTQRQIGEKRLETAWLLLIVAAIGFGAAYMVIAILARARALTGRGLGFLCAVGFWILVAGTIVGIWQLTVSFWEYSSSPVPVLIPASMALGLL